MVRMMTIAFCRLAVVLFLFGSAVSIRADVIDFETGSLFLFPGQTGSLEGFNFTAAGDTGALVKVPAGCASPCVSNGTRTLVTINGANVTIAPTVGGTFSLSAFDVAGVFGTSQDVTSLEVIGNLFGGGQITETFGVNPSVFQTFSLLPGFTNLTSAEFIALAPTSLPQFQLDNIQTTTTAVPEPASLVLLGSLAVFLSYKQHKLHPRRRT